MPIEKMTKPSCYVAVGASAGGLEALERVFDQAPANEGLAFFVIQHLSPDFKSVMDELLARRTELAIHRAEDGMVVEPNTIYLNTPKKEMRIEDGRLRLVEKDLSKGLSLPIDIFFRSLAVDVGPHGVAIVLSGSGSDGSRGIKDVHERGGLIIVQDPATADFESMPAAAIDTGLVNFILPPEEMGDTLTRHVRHPYPADRKPAILPTSDSSDDGVLAEVFALLLDQHGIDFAHYNPTTVVRRIERRIQLVGAPGIEEYIERLTTEPDEIDTLYRDLLIEVTQFFRDKPAFDRLRHDFLAPAIEAAAGPLDEEFRLWIAGCATGEEAYSLAILCQEEMDRIGSRRPVRVFATDVHRSSLDLAGAGRYSVESIADLEPARLERFFEKEGELYRVSPELRKLVVFAQHNLLKDTPFTKIDLVSCRNVLIYFQPAAQRKILASFHFALKVGGGLFLGPSESLAALEEEFEPVDRHWNIFTKKRDKRLSMDLRMPIPNKIKGNRFLARQQEQQQLRPRISVEGGNPRLLRVYDELLAERMAPGLLIDERRQLVHTFGKDPRRFLGPAAGRASSDVLDMLDEDLRVPLGAAIQRAGKEQVPVVYKDVRLRGEDFDDLVKMVVKPLPDSKGEELYFLITFESKEAPKPPEPEIVTEAGTYNLDEASRQRIGVLESELQYTKESLQTTVEELQTSNEELQATNEELVASNEELQSTNEELHSVNSEYQQKIRELTELTRDMDNLLLSTEIGTIFLDRGLCIRKFTPAIAEAFNLLPQDLGRPLKHISNNLDDQQLLGDAEKVLETGEPREREVSNAGAGRFLMRIQPYRGKASKIEGVVITFVDIGAMKQAEAAHEFLLDHLPIFVLHKDLQGRITYVNQKFCELASKPAEELIGKSDAELYSPELAAEYLRADRETIETGEIRETVEEHDAGGVKMKVLTVKSPLRGADGMVDGLQVLFWDISDLKRTQAELERSNEELHQFAYVVSHDLQAPLRTISKFAELIAQRYGDQLDEKGGRWIEHLVKSTGSAQAMIRGLLDYSRLQTIAQSVRVVESAEAVDEALDLLGTATTDAGAEVTRGDLPKVAGDPAQLTQLFLNLINNAIRYRREDAPPRIDISVIEAPNQMWQFTVKDNGIGIDPSQQESVFELFARLNPKGVSGTGMGLSICHRVVETHGGRIWVESDGEGHGSAFHFTLPAGEYRESSEA
ncbi:MAG: two-component system CheB/CheR fusion protein [Verrucomicrobiales bacterium]|jgi:two-component system CheB/CheR fusion protein